MCEKFALIIFCQQICTVLKVTELAVGDDRWNYIDDFFKAGGSKKIMWYYQEPTTQDYFPGGSKSMADNQS